MIPVRIEKYDGVKCLIISNEYLTAKHNKMRGGRTGYLKWLTALLRKNGFWRPISVDGQRLRRYAEAFPGAEVFEDAYVVAQAI